MFLKRNRMRVLKQNLERFGGNEVINQTEQTKMIEDHKRLFDNTVLMIFLFLN